jgi:hypothetical protein
MFNIKTLLHVDQSIDISHKEQLMAYIHYITEI